MTTERHDHPEIYRDLSGFNQRVSDIEREQGGLGVLVRRNADDIQNLFKLSEKNISDIHALNNLVSGLIGKVTGAVTVVVVLVQLGFLVVNVLSK